MFCMTLIRATRTTAVMFALFGMCAIVGMC